MECVKRATIVYIYGHGAPGYIGFGPKGGWYAKWQEGIKKECAIDQNDFRTVKFTGFVGCNTALTDRVYGNLLDEAIKQGATAALGFRDRLGYNPSEIEKDPGIIWTKEFWKAALGWLDEDNNGQLDSPKSIKGAARHAPEEVKKKTGSYWGYDSWEVRGEDLLLAPARCK